MILTPVDPIPSCPVNVEEARDYLRLTDYDIASGHLTGFLVAATENVQALLGRQLTPATYDLQLDGFPGGPIEVPMPPLKGVESITYTATDGTETELTGFIVDLAGGRIVPAYGTSWPCTRAVPGSVKIRLTCGYEDGQAPFGVKAAILLLVGDLLENREGQIVGVTIRDNPTLDRLLAPYRVWP